MPNGPPDSVSRRRFRGVQEGVDGVHAIAEEVPLRQALPSLPGEGSGQAEGANRYAEILSVNLTTPPFEYNAREVTHIDEMTFGEPYGIEMDGNLYNLHEKNSGGVAQVPVGAIVRFWPEGDVFFFEWLHWRGTF